LIGLGRISDDLVVLVVVFVVVVVVVALTQFKTYTLGRHLWRLYGRHRQWLDDTSDG
jgi:hypothetical protein